MFDLPKAVLVRLALALHCVMAVWRVTVMKEDQVWWYLAGGLGPFFIEGLVTIIKRKGKEFKWYVFLNTFYLVVM